MDLLRRTLVTEPPAFRSFRDDKPTLLVSWWCTLYSIAVILIRVCGRYIRTERLFGEDGTMLLAIIPLLMRMALVHVVLLYGTNNTVTAGLTVEAIRHRELGSRLVLASRVFYAAYLWAIKYSVSMFLRTLTAAVWSNSHQRLLRYLHILLAVTFVGTVISVFAECRPFPHYWQVVPDPGGHCRQGSAHLLTMGSLNIITNVALVVFPLRMILQARLPTVTKLSILTRIALPIASVAFTCYQMPYIISQRFFQPTRSLLASFDILLATFISNAIVLLSLLQGRGYKKTKYRHGTAQAGFHNKGTMGITGAPRGRADSSPNQTKWGSDENLVQGSGDYGGQGKGMVINMEVLPSKKRASTAVVAVEAPSRTSSDTPPEVPPKAKLQEIRIASTWEVSVENK